MALGFSSIPLWKYGGGFVWDECRDGGGGEGLLFQVLVHLPPPLRPVSEAVLQNVYAGVYLVAHLKKNRLQDGQLCVQPRLFARFQPFEYGLIFLIGQRTGVRPALCLRVTKFKAHLVFSPGADLRWVVAVCHRRSPQSL